MSTPIQVKHTIKNGKLVSEANMWRLFAIGVAGGAKNTITSEVDVNTYVPRYKFVKEPEGYIVREVKFNYGVAGHTETLRQQVILVASYGFSVICEEECPFNEF